MTGISSRKLLVDVIGSLAMERRAFSRINMHMFVFIKHAEGEAVGEATTISLNGMFVKTAKRLPKHTKVNVHIQLDSEQGNRSLSFEGSVVRKAEKNGGIAIHIDSIGMDSFLLWRQIVASAMAAENRLTGNHITREAS